MGHIGSVLFVCTGNLCRSPMAEGILKNMLERSLVHGTRVSSAGTFGVEGQPAAPMAVQVCEKHGIDISGHVARELTEEMVRESDLVVVMEFDHLHRVLDMVPEAVDKTRMLTQFGGQNKKLYHSIPDPYGRARREYESCYSRILEHLKSLLKVLKKDDDHKTE